MIEVTYKNNTLKRICTDYGVAVRKHGLQMAEIIHRRISEIEAADSIEMLVRYNIGRCHRLQGDRRSQYAMDLIHPFRLILEPDEVMIRVVKVIEIEDYH